MEKAYAKALAEVVKGGVKEEDAFKQLMTHLKESGRLKILPQLLRELRTQSERQNSREPMLEVASEAEAKTAEAEIKKEGVTAKAIVNPTLIRGWRLTTADRLIDRSGKSALIDLYRKVTH